MFKFIKILVVLIVLIVAGAFLYDKYRSVTCCCDEGKAD
jgi:hypothetical protein